jgi:hypothetical protein
MALIGVMLSISPLANVGLGRCGASGRHLLKLEIHGRWIPRGLDH